MVACDSKGECAQLAIVTCLRLTRGGSAHLSTGMFEMIIYGMAYIFDGGNDCCVKAASKPAFWSFVNV